MSCDSQSLFSSIINYPFSFLVINSPYGYTIIWMWWGVLCFAICYSHYSRTSNSNTWVYFSELQAAVQS